MTTLTDRPNTALLIIDVQKQVMDGAHDRDRVIANVKSLADTARARDVPIVWVQHSSGDMARGSDGWQYVAELDPREDEPLVHKQFPDAFEETGLEKILAVLQVGRLVLAGAQTDECIRGTLHGAIVRGYDATLVEDAHTTLDYSEFGAPPPDKVIAHTNLYWKYHEAPGRTAGTTTTDTVDFG